MQTPTDESLMLSAKRGDTRAFEELVIRYSGWATTVAYRFTSDMGLAEEIAQDAFTKLYFARERYQSKASFKTYFYSILRHTMIDQRRRNKASAVVSLEQAITLVDRDTSINPEVAALEDEDARLVQRALSQLPEEQRLVLVAREFGQLSYLEIADSTGLSLANVKVLIHRGRKQLAELLKGCV